MQKQSHNHPTHPIGIYDSGIGGLTVAQAVSKILPEENIIYFGDTAHLPYGDKSAAAIQAYSVKIAHMLLEQNCKIILIACNSASAAAFDLMQEYVASRATVINVIDPVVDYLAKHYANKTIGLIGTTQTVSSNVYQQKIAALDNNITLHAHAAPLLASAIEQGFNNKKIINDLLEEYLNVPELKNIDALVLGCTHYPVISEDIANFYHNKIDIINGPDIVAESISQTLKTNNLLHTNNHSTKHFYISDYTESFVDAAKLFFSNGIKLEHFPLWE